MDAFYDKLDAFFERVEELRLRLVSHPLFPNRKIAYGAASAVVSAAVLKLGFDLTDPTVAYLTPIATGYIVSWLVTDGPAIEQHVDESTIEAEEQAVATGEIPAGETGEDSPPAEPPAG